MADTRSAGSRGGGRSGGSKRGGGRSGAGTTQSAEKVIEQHMKDGNTIGEQEVPFHRPPWYRAFSFGLITGAFFLFSWVGQFVTQLIVERNEAEQHGQSFQWGDYYAQFFASTFENWQSEFLQLVWQAAGLALFYFWGSSQSKEGDERIEQKLDLLLRDRGIDPTKL
jgi:hypothetical protein